MKKTFHLFLIALLGISVSAVHAQDKPKQKYILAKGTKMFTGRLYANYSSGGPDFRSLAIGVSEQNGFFVANNFSIGTTLGYEFHHTRQIQMSPSSGLVRTIQVGHTPSIGINLRYYKMFTERFGFFGQFSPTVMVAFYRNRVEGIPSSFNTSHSVGLDISITPNLVYFVTKKFAVEAGFGALRYAHTFNSNSHSAELGVRPNLNLGMSFYFGPGVQPKK